MVDTWATVGSCAQIGKNVHLSGGVGIGGVLEPPEPPPQEATLMESIARYRYVALLLRCVMALLFMVIPCALYGVWIVCCWCAYHQFSAPVAHVNW